MKRVAAVLATALLTVFVTATTALAQTDYPPTPSPTTSVAGGGGGNTGGGTAFTGGEVSYAALAFAVLLVVGVATLMVARRRAARLAG